MSLLCSEGKEVCYRDGSWWNPVNTFEDAPLWCAQTPFRVTVLQGILSGSSDIVAKILREQKPPRQIHKMLNLQERQRDKRELGRDHENASCSHFNYYASYPAVFLTCPFTLLYQLKSKVILPLL